MKIRSMLLFFMILTGAVAGAAQSKTVTNADLTKYKEARVKAETDLRENYAKLGFASPEERERRNAQAAKEAEALSARLKSERLAQEQLDAQRQAAEAYAAAAARAAAAQRIVESQTYDTGGYFWYQGRRYRRSSPFTATQPGYFAGGAFWPTGPATPPRPMWVTPRH